MNKSLSENQTGELISKSSDLWYFGTVICGVFFWRD